MSTTFPDALTTWDETAEPKGRPTIADIERRIIADALALDPTLVHPDREWHPVTNPLRPEFLGPDRRQSARPTCPSCGVQHDYTALLAHILGGAS